MSRSQSFAFASIGSGSKGNGTLVALEDTCVLVDCGFSLKETEARLQRLQVNPEQLTAIVVTHEHSDHISGVGALARKYALPVYLTAGTWRSGRLGDVPQYHIINSHETFQLGRLTIQSIAVPHDAKEPVQYIFRSGTQALGILTDLGSITSHVVEHYCHCDALLLEANHCVQMLEAGPYPQHLKQRVGGDWGHLSNHQTAVLLQAMIKPLKHLVLAHLSEQNNAPSRVEEHLRPWWPKADNILFACQKRGFDWLLIEERAAHEQG